jgi:hypothetical protein
MKYGGDVNTGMADGATPVWIVSYMGHSEMLHTLLKAGANARTAEYGGTPALHSAAAEGHLPAVRILAESWPLDRRPWRMFCLGAGAESELRAFLAPTDAADVSTTNYLPMLYKPEMMKEIWKFLHKPRYVELGKLNRQGKTAARVAADAQKDQVAELLRQLSLSVL